LGTIGNASAAEHKKTRTKFQSNLTKLARKHLGRIKLFAVSEVGSNGRLHNHYCLVSDFEVRQSIIKKLWAEAAEGWRTIVSHGRPRSIDARAKYQFKDLKEPGNVRLLRKGTPRITWGHLDFYPEGKAAIWRNFVNELKGQQHEHGQKERNADEPERGDEPGPHQAQTHEAHRLSRPALERRPDLE
jgi:hypothetical protein